MPRHSLVRVCPLHWSQILVRDAQYCATPYANLACVANVSKCKFRQTLHFSLTDNHASLLLAHPSSCQCGLWKWDHMRRQYEKFTHMIDASMASANVPPSNRMNCGTSQDGLDTPESPDNTHVPHCCHYGHIFARDAGLSSDCCSLQSLESRLSHLSGTCARVKAYGPDPHQHRQ